MDETEIAVLGSLWRAWGEAVADLDDGEWTTPTRCEGWDVAALTAHVSQGVGGLAALVRARRTDDPVEHADAPALLRALKPDAEVADALAGKAARQAVDDAAATGSAGLVARFLDDGPGVIEEAAAVGGAAAVEYFRRGTTTVTAATVVRVVEATVHWLDLADALGLDADALPPAALSITSDFLVALTGPVTFVEIATGRRPATVFPVHA